MDINHALQSGQRRVSSRFLNQATNPARGSVSISTSNTDFTEVDIPEGAVGLFTSATQNFKLYFHEPGASAPSVGSTTAYISQSGTGGRNAYYGLDPDDPPSIWVAADTTSTEFVFVFVF